MRREPPHLDRLEDYAIFLDLDGTLADISPLPTLARVAPKVVETLSLLSLRLAGALAVVSGRQLEEIDRLIEPHQFPAAGIHGAQLRQANGYVHVESDLAHEIATVERDVLASLGALDAVVIERKPYSIAIHFRQNPSREMEITDLAARVVSERPQLKFLTGKMIVEILPVSVDKGKAITRLMESPPFRGRIPVFAGDDVTDEDGFAAVNTLGGISIKIGPGPSLADYGFANADGFRDWLAGLAERKVGERSS